MKELIGRITRALVDYPNQIFVKEVQGSNLTLLELHVAKADIGKVIGKQGRTIEAIRWILKAAAVAKGKRVVLEIIDRPETAVFYKRSRPSDAGEPVRCEYSDAA